MMNLILTSSRQPLAVSREPAMKNGISKQQTAMADSPKTRLLSVLKLINSE